MNYLQICQRVHDIVGFQGQFTGVAATGYQAVLTAAVREAYEDVQRYRAEWNWLKQNRPANVDETKSVYTLAELFSGQPVDFADYRYINWTKDSATRARRLQEVDWDTFALMKFTNGDSPRYWTYDPATYDLYLSPLDQLYTIDIFYTLTLDLLTLNTQVPLIPGRHHQIIVYGACMKLATFVGNPTLFDTYSVKYAEELGQLMRETNPAKVVTKRPIA